MTNNRAYGTNMTHNSAYGPMATNQNEEAIYDYIDPEYVIVDDIQDAPPQPLPIPAVKNKEQTSSPDHSATDYEIPTLENKQ